VLESGDLFDGKYRVVRLTGEGGMGTVYEARHELLGTSVALKFLNADLADHPGVSERFLQEARIAATIASPYVARVTDVSRGPDGRPYLVMDFVTGESLERVLEREHKLPVEQACDFASQVASGLEAAHSIGAVHRDLKPANVIVTQTADGPLLKLIDFGIAKVREGSGARGLTRTGVVLGTPEYMPPEQLFAASDVDARADVYALGVLLFEMLSGRRPAEGDGPEEIVGKVLSGEVLTLEKLEPELPPELHEIVRRATAGDRDQRFASVRELGARLERFRGARESIPKTLPPIDEPVFGKGTTEDAPAIHELPAPSKGATQAASMTPFAPGPPPTAPAPRRKQTRTGGVIALLVVLLVGIGAAMAVVGSRHPGPAAPPLPPPMTTPEGPSTDPPPQTPGAASPDPGTPPIAPPASPPERRSPASPATPTSPASPPNLPPAATSDAGSLPLPIPLPSSFPALPSSLPFPTAFPTALPSTFPPTFPGLPPAPTGSSAPPKSSGGVGRPPIRSPREPE
jgi:serine/threonine-protein kinase